jgi:hypothetical protein
VLAIILIEACPCPLLIFIKDINSVDLIAVHGWIQLPPPGRVAVSEPPHRQACSAESRDTCIAATFIFIFIFWLSNWRSPVILDFFLDENQFTSFIRIDKRQYK